MSAVNELTTDHAICRIFLTVITTTLSGQYPNVWLLLKILETISQCTLSHF